MKNFAYENNFFKCKLCGDINVHKKNNNRFRNLEKNENALDHFEQYHSTSIVCPSCYSEHNRFDKVHRKEVFKKRSNIEVI